MQQFFYKAVLSKEKAFDKIVKGFRGKISIILLGPSRTQQFAEITDHVFLK